MSGDDYQLDENIREDEKILEQEDERRHIEREADKLVEAESVLLHHPVAWMCDYFNSLLYPYGSLIVEAERVNEIRGSFRAHAQILYDIGHKDGEAAALRVANQTE